ncbi:MAG TPA: hypothetical protein VII25_02280 [Candidatus Acidoferrum sp.]
MANSSAPATSLSEEGGNIRKAGMWFVVVGSLGAIVMSWVVFHSLEANKVLLGANSTVTDTVK